MKELIERAIQINEELVAKLKELEELEEPNLLGADGKYFDKESMSIKDVVNEPTFKVGDWVLIKKPKDVGQKPPYWVSSMDIYDRLLLEIEKINSYGHLVIDGWRFHPDWCTKAEAPKPEVGDICIFWDEDKSGAVIGKLTSIDTSHYPYEVVDVLSYKNCIKFESMEQYNKFIKE